MLIKCPECELQISSKAISCPHCGYPFDRSEVRRKKRNKNNKRRRLPNGFGQISEIKGKNLRNPFRAMVSIGKDENGRPICKLLHPASYFRTYNEAYYALMEYNKNPYVFANKMTLKELYARWSERHFKNVSMSVIIQYRSAWNYLSLIYDMKVVDIKVRHIKLCMEEGTYKGKTASANMKRIIKMLLDLMFDYAVEFEIVEKNCSRTIKLNKQIIKESSIVKNPHMIFTDEEIETLWKNEKNLQVQLLLIQCYSGLRPQELGLVELKNVDIENWSFTGGIKTESGKDRFVPIHPKIRSMFKSYYDSAKVLSFKYIFSLNRDQKEIHLNYHKYRNIFDKVISNLNLNKEHKPHDCRKHFISMAKRYKLDEYAIKYIVGHSIIDITESIYTERDNDWLLSEIEKIK